MDRKTIITESLNYIENNIKNKITSDEIFDQAEKREVLEETGVEYEIDRLAFLANFHNTCSLKNLETPTQ